MAWLSSALFRFSSGGAASLRGRVHQFFGAVGAVDGCAAVRRLWAARRGGARPPRRARVAPGGRGASRGAAAPAAATRKAVSIYFSRV